MEITSIKFSEPQDKKGAIRQFVSICLNKQLIIRSLRIIETNSGDFFVSFPSRKMQNGNRLFSSFPIEESFRLYVQTKVLETYNEFLKTKNLPIEDPIIIK